MVDIQREMVAANMEIGERLGSLLMGGVDREGVLAEIRRLQSRLSCQAAEFQSLAARYRDLE
jgi:hypothetical protein